MSQTYTSDVLICGAGASGLATAVQLIRENPLLQIVLIDPDFSYTKSKTWCFWDEAVAPDKSLIKKSWKRLSVLDHNSTFTEIFSSPVYFCIDSKEYRSKIVTELKSNNNIKLIQDRVTKIDQDNIVDVQNNSTFKSEYVIDSRFDSIYGLDLNSKANTLWQHFKGWTVETKSATFDPDHAILMDFRVPQNDGFAFVYLLPYSETNALIELTYFNSNIPDQSHYDPIILKYLQEHWNLSNSDAVKGFEIIDTEYGIIPMTDLPISPSNTSHYTKTGLSGGLAKASTGYAFSRSQRYAKLLSELISAQQPLKHWKSDLRFQFYDMQILHLLRNSPEHCVQIFMDLFTKNGFKLVFDFLDEKTGFADDLKIMSSVPSYSVFFKALWKTKYKLKYLISGD